MMQLKTIIPKCMLLLGVLSIISCSSDGADSSPVVVDDGVSPVTMTLAVNPATEYQLIRGFGGINHPLWRGDLTPSDREKVFGLNDGQLGFSILRVQIDPRPSKWALELETAKYAVDNGVIVFASPWHAPDEFLDPNNTEDKVILPEYYGAYANHLNDFNNFMEENGAPLYAVSIQNEPDIGEWTQWTPTEILTFTQENAPSINNKIIAPESFQFRRNYSDPILNDPTALANVDIIGGHIYGGGLSAYSLAENKGKEIWMTEYLMNQDATSSWSSLNDSVIWGESMKMLSTMHDAMSFNWNAYMWWYIKRYYSFIGEGDQGTTDGEVLKRGYAFSHFSRFVRPGYKRVQLQLQKNKGLEATAYTGDSKTTMVILNPTAEKIKGVAITIGENVPDSASLYITSLSKNVEKSTLSKDKDALYFSIPANSVATVVIPN